MVAQNELNVTNT